MKGETIMNYEFEEIDYTELEEMEEVITPFDGTVGCCP